MNEHLTIINLHEQVHCVALTLEIMTKHQKHLKVKGILDRLERMEKVMLELLCTTQSFNRALEILKAEKPESKAEVASEIVEKDTEEAFTLLEDMLRGVYNYNFTNILNIDNKNNGEGLSDPDVFHLMCEILQVKTSLGKAITLLSIK